MFRPRHFAASMFAPSHFEGRAFVITVVTADEVRHGVAYDGPEFESIVDRLIKEDEEILLMVVSFIEVSNL